MYIVDSYHQYGVGSRPALLIVKIGTLDSQPQVIKFASCLPMVGGSLRVVQHECHNNKKNTNRK
jgi:hypothetical protein